MAKEAKRKMAEEKKRVDTFAGSSGTLKEGVGDRYIRATQEDLLREGFEFHEDLSKLYTSLCRLEEPRKEKCLPLVCPSVELYGAIVGWQLEDEEPVVAPATGGEGEGGEGQQRPPQCGFLPPRPLRDRNTYKSYRWMFSPLHERAIALEERLDEMMGAIASSARVPTDSMSIGRICAESEASRVNATSVSLELAKGSNSSGLGGGVGNGRMSLDLREVPRFAVFPGQVVGVQGTPTFGDRLSVTALFTSGSAPYARMPLKNARALARVRGKGGPVRAWVAAGPFTDPRDLKFAALEQLLADVVGAGEESRPDVLILQGPFIDAEHPLIKSTAPLAKYEGDEVEEQLPKLSTYNHIWSDTGAWCSSGVFCVCVCVCVCSTGICGAQVYFPPPSSQYIPLKIPAFLTPLCLPSLLDLLFLLRFSPCSSGYDKQVPRQ